MSEQFAFQQVLRNCGAIDRMKHLVLPATVLIDCPRDDFLARSRFAEDQDGDITWGDAADGAKDFDHGRAVAEQQVAAVLSVARCRTAGQNGGPAGHATRFQGRVNHRQYVIRFKRLGDVLEGAPAHGMNRGSSRSVPGHQDHRYATVQFAKVMQHPDSGLVGKLDVEQYCVRLFLAKELEPLRGCIRREHNIVRAGQRQLHALEDQRVVIDHQQRTWFVRRVHCGIVLLLVGFWFTPVSSSLSASRR